MKIFVVIATMALLAGCNRSGVTAGPMRHYAVTGKIVALDQKHQAATIDAAAIPNYMEAMTMDYPIKSKNEFRSLKVGERITGTLEVASDETYTLTDIKPAK